MTAALLTLAALLLLALTFVCGWAARSRRQRTLEAHRDEVRRLRLEEGRPTPRHPGTAGNARIRRAAFLSETGDADQQ